MPREILNLHDIQNTPEGIYQGLLVLREDFDSHIHDGTNSKEFDTLHVRTLVAGNSVIATTSLSVRKKNYSDTTAGFWVGIDSNTAKLNLGNATQFVKWDGTALTITGTIQTATGTGVRIVQSASDNTLTFYNASNAAVTQLGGGANVATALRVTLDATTTKGVRVDSATAGDIGFEFNASGNYASTGVNIQLTGATSSGTGINVNHDGSSGKGVTVDTSAGARGVEVNNSSTGVALYLNGSGTTHGISLFINHTGDSSKGIEVLYQGRANAVYIESTDNSNDAAALYVTGDTASQSSGNYVAHFVRTDSGYVVGITSSINTATNIVGLEFNIANAGAGVEYAMSFAGSEYLSSAVGGNQDKKIKVLIGGAAYYIPAYDA